MSVDCYAVSFVDTDQWASPKHHMKGLSRYNSTLIGRKNQAKYENDCVSRNGHKIKIAQPNSMILVSFSFAEDALFNDVSKYDTFSSQSTENQPFRFVWDTLYIYLSIYKCIYTQPQIKVNSVWHFLDITRNTCT